MRKRNRLLVNFGPVLALLLVLSLLAACSGAAPQAPVQGTETTGAATVASGAGGTEEPASTTAATESAQGTELPDTSGTAAPGAAAGDGYTAPNSQVCQDVAADVQATLAAEDDAVTVEENAPFEDVVTGGTGTGCQVTVTGTGEDFPDYEDFTGIADALNVVFQSAGWDPDPAYLADSPAGTAFAMRDDNLLALLSVDVQPGPAASCPADQPISECGLTPDQLNYTIQVNVASQGQTQ